LRAIRALATVAFTILLTGCAALSGLLGDRPPTAVLSASPTQGLAPLLVRFDATKSEDDGQIVEYAWHLGDGTAETSSATSLVDHTYVRSGTFDIRLVVIDDDGNSSECSITIDVENRPPVANLLLSSDSPIVGDRVEFDASGSFDSDGDVVDVAWEFGDGETARGTNVSHTYAEVGVYTMRLTIEDNGGEAASLVHAITVHLGGSGGCGGGTPICLRLD